MQAKDLAALLSAPPSHVYLSPAFKGVEFAGMSRVPKLWIGADGVMRLAWMDANGRPDPRDTHRVQTVLPLDQIVILRTEADASGPGERPFNN